MSLGKSIIYSFYIKLTKEKYMAKIHSIETFGTVDGPGIRFVIFMQGCPMRCAYCHNPDTWNTLGGTEMTADELIIQVEKYRHYFGEDGGVTLSGGEPLLQMDFVIELFKKLKHKNISTCLDTSGITFCEQNKAKFDELIKYTDLVLLDIKHIDDQKHRWLTNFSNDNVLKFAQYLNKNNIPMWVRYVLVPGINSDEKSLYLLKDFLDTLSNIQNIEILPYHTMGVQKYEQLGIDYRLKDIEPPTAEQINLATTILAKEKN